jgi:hypothetical protein
VLGVVHGVGDELTDVVVLQPVEHLGALAAGTHQVRHPQLGQVLRHRRRGLADAAGQIVHRHLAIAQ